MPEDDADLDEDEVEALESAIEADYDIGDTIRRSLVRSSCLSGSDAVLSVWVVGGGEWAGGLDGGVGARWWLGAWGGAG